MKAAQLRQAILQAAVQGKLVPQNPQDEPASVLLKRVQQERAQLIEKGKIKKEKPFPPVTGEEITYELPGGWAWCRLSEIAFIGTGSTPLKSNPRYYEGGTIPWIMSAATNDEYITSCDTYVTEYAMENNSLTLNPCGTLVMAMYGQGKTRGQISELMIDATTNQACATINVSNVIDKRYVKIFLREIYYKIRALADGGAQPNLNLDKIKNYIISLPPLSEQDRIFLKVNELMLFCDELEAAEKELDALESNLAEYLSKSILQAVVQGKLVPQNIHDEPASELLKRIQAEKARLVKEGKIKKEKPLPPITEDEIPYDLPDGWEWCRLGDVCSVNPRNQLANETVVSFVPMTLISDEYFGGHQQEERKWASVKQGFTHFAEGDIALAKITPCFQNGKSCIMTGLKNGFGAGTTELHILRGLGVFPRYILAFLKNPMFLGDGKKNMTGTAGQQRVPTDYLKNTLFPLPPLAEQQRIVAKIDELMSLCAQLKNIDVNALSVQPAPLLFRPTPESAPQAEPEERYAIAARGELPEELPESVTSAIDKMFQRKRHD